MGLINWSVSHSARGSESGTSETSPGLKDLGGKEDRERNKDKTRILRLEGKKEEATLVKMRSGRRLGGGSDYDIQPLLSGIAFPSVCLLLLCLMSYYY